jgi:3-phenylpropionate/cinnamic acid dioxygenase small subunit
MTDDVQAITAMVHRYCELFDTGDFDAFARQFEHGRWFRAEPGYEATRAWIEANVHTYDGLPGTKHVTTNLVVDVDGDAATASSYITVLQAVPGLPLQPIFSGRYRDRFERADGGWRWVERGVLGDLYGDTSHHTRTTRAAPATPSIREVADELADRQEIADLCVRYARALDRHDWEALAACFVADAVYLYPGGRTDGVEAVVERCRAALTPLDASQHLIGSILTAVDGDEGRASSYFHAQHVRAGTEGGDTFVIAGSYDDRVVRTAEGWRIAQRDQTYTWTAGNRAVVRR